MDNIALILILILAFAIAIVIVILGLLVFGLTRKMDILVRRIYTPLPESPRNTLDSFLLTQRHWSAKTFGLGAGRWKGIVAHVEKELREIERDPLDLEEWIDVIILGFDGAWRTGATNHAIISALFAKQAKNRTREWIVSEDPAIPSEHRRKLSDVLMAGVDPAPGKDWVAVEEVANDFDKWKAEVYEPAMATPQPAPTSIDISVYPHKVTGKWVVQVGDDVSHLAQFESEEAAKQYARQTGELIKRQMDILFNGELPIGPVEPPAATPIGSKVTNLRRLSPEDMQRVLTDPEAYAEWRGVCGLEADGKVKDNKEVT